jgi:MFS family permease
VFTVLTAFSVGLYDFVVYQFIARLFTVTEVGVGSIILTEELPARYRGAGIALMFSAGLIGGILGSALFPHLVHTNLGWRMLYLVGGGLLLLLGYYWSLSPHDERRLCRFGIGDLLLWQTFGSLPCVVYSACLPCTLLPL